MWTVYTPPSTAALSALLRTRGVEPAQQDFFDDHTAIEQLLFELLLHLGTRRGNPSAHATQ